MAMNELAMELRAVDPAGRTVSGVVAPYDEVSYLVPDPAGERIVRGAFRKSIEQKGSKIRLFTGHENRKAGVGHAVVWEDGPEGLVGTFRLSDTVRGREVLEELVSDDYGGLSVGFRPLVSTRGEDGVREVREAALMEVSLVGLPAYASARVLAVRGAEELAELLAPFTNRPVVDLAPIPAVWLFDGAR